MSAARRYRTLWFVIVIAVVLVGAQAMELPWDWPGRHPDPVHGFHFYVELKADDTAVPIENKNAYIKQTVAYQAADVRIGFLVVLRLTPPTDRSPSGHLTDYVSHAIVTVDGNATDRHIVMLEVPGNQTRPSAAR